ncbi:MAG: hypothetical protein RSC49_03375 [Clostridium sp.]
MAKTSKKALGAAMAGVMAVGAVAGAAGAVQEVRAGVAEDVKLIHAKIEHFRTSLKKNYLGLKNVAQWQAYEKELKVLIGKLPAGSTQDKYKARLDVCVSLLNAAAKVNHVEKSLTTNFNGIKNAEVWSVYLKDGNDLLGKVDKEFEGRKAELVERLAKAKTTVDGIIKKHEDALAEATKLYDAAVKSNTLTDAQKALDAAKKLGTHTSSAELVAKCEALIAKLNEKLSVVSATAVNQQMIQVKFNKKVDESSALNEVNYTLDGVKLSALSGSTNYISLDSTGTVATIYYNTGLSQDQKVTLGVTGVVEDKTFSRMTDYSTALTIKDTANPTIVGAEVINGNKEVVVTLSEGVVSAGTISDYTLNGSALTTFGVSSVAFVQDAYTSDGAQNLKNKVKITFNSSLAAGNYALALKDGRIADPAGFYANGQSAKFTVTSDASALAVISTTATAGQNGTVEIKFNKSLGTILSGYKLNEGSSVTPVLKANTKDTVVLTGAVLEGANIVRIPGAQKDAYGNKIGENDLVVSVNATRDTVKPTVSNVFALSDKKVRVKFSENVNVAPFVTAKANYTIKDAGGVVYSSTVNAGGYTISPAANGDNSMVDIDFTTALPGSNYTVDIKGVKDGAGNEMDAFTTSFVSPDKTAPTLATTPANKAVVNVVNRTVEVFFSEAMDVSTLTNKANYLYSETNSSDYNALPISATLEAGSNGKSVKITYPGTINVANIDDIKVLNVKDAAGNLINGGSEATGVPAASLGVAPNIVEGSSKVVADSEKVTLTFETNQQLVTIDKADFANFLTGGSVSATAPDNATITGKVVTLTYLSTNANYAAIKNAGSSVSINGSFTASAGTDTTNAYGDILTTTGLSAVGLKVKDQIAPELVSTTPIQVATGNITLTFNEAISGENLGELKDDVVVTVGGAYTTIDTASVAGNTITLTTVDALPGNTVTLSLVSGKISMKDAAGNVFVPTTANKNLWSVGLAQSVAATAGKVTATNAPTVATAVATGSLVVKVDGTAAANTFTLTLDGTLVNTFANEAALVTALGNATNSTSAKLSTVADVTVVGGKIVITSKTTGTSSTVAVTTSGTNAVAVATLTGFAGTETNTGSAQVPAANGGNFVQ